MGNITRISIITMIILIGLTGVSAAESFFTVNWRQVEEGQTEVLYSGDLIEEEIIFAVPWSPDIESMEISLDNGYTWDDMNVGDQHFIFRYVPVDGERMQVLLKKENKNGGSQTINTKTVVIYHDEI